MYLIFLSEEPMKLKRQYNFLIFFLFIKQHTKRYITEELRGENKSIPRLGGYIFI